ncbi:MAG: hypothetical protein AB9869_12440 [Verrucomicrobiia bacterium]
MTQAPLQTQPVNPVHCRHCRHALNPEDRFCPQCGKCVHGTSFTRLFTFQPLTPEQAAGYWRGFFRPFFITAFIFFALFFMAAACLVVVWFLMFRP